ncbi:hypothetical protein AAFC00_001987 [Neodothiora populina]|uniref:Indole-diterpene biosynthesis protein PaxU n=1 Tax=Neodothiora populina TaxID=2781224 RepID=A0ABR3PH31_9PEZI
MSAPLNQSPLQNFNKLTDAISLSEPTTKPLHSKIVPDDISLIVICAWMEATPKHIAKYSAYYRDTYPAASILILESKFPDVIYRTSKIQQSRLGPACDVVIDRRSQGKVLLHIFSNGGAHTASQLACALSSIAPSNSLSSPTKSRLFCAMVLDSCPGRLDFARGTKAMLASAPRSAIGRFVAFVFAYTVIFFMYFLKAHGVQDAVSFARAKLNDTELFALDTPRLYVYSQADEMIGWKDVQDHAEEARKKGYSDVLALPFVESRHCAHIVVDAKRYWGAVSDIIKH